MHISVQLNSRQEPSTVLWNFFFPCEFLSFPEFCPANSSYCSFPRLSDLSLNLGVHQALPGSSFPMLWTRTSLLTVSRSNRRPHIVSSQGPLNFIAWCPVSHKVLFYIFYPSFCCCFRQEGKCDLGYSSFSYQIMCFMVPKFHGSL